MSEGLDIAKVVELIMENPQIIEQISNLAKQKSKGTEDEKQETPALPTVAETVEKTQLEATYRTESKNKSNRSQLLCALKPYVSTERAKAIDSMLAIADIMEMMKSR